MYEIKEYYVFANKNRYYKAKFSLEETKKATKTMARLTLN